MQNRLFQSNQKKLFEMIDGYDRENEVRPDADESKKFWSELWDKNVTHNEHAEWLTTMKREYQNVGMQPNINITEEKVKKTDKKDAKVESLWTRWSSWILVEGVYKFALQDSRTT